MTPDARRRALAVWLWTVAVLVFAMVLVGGATRLTQSGLSIVEWKPVTGVLPPLSAGDWQAEFAKYRTIPQYQQRKAGMTLDEFKVIYWWEWAHRLLGRVVGAVFLLPLLWFAWRGWIGPGLRRRLWLIFGLGAVQGIAGWWMVASGLADRVSVSQYRLAFHLTLACVILAAIVWTAQRLLPHAASDVGDGGAKGTPSRRHDHAPLHDRSMRLRTSALVLVVLVLCQIYLGALVAGLHAGLVYNTWPLIDGGLVPAASRLFFDEPWWRNFFENALMVQFVHRTVAYTLWAAAVLHAIDAARAGRGGTPLVLALALATLVTAQAALGITMLLQQAPIGLALTHQAVAVVVLTLAVVHAERLAPPTVSVPAQAQAQAPLRASTHPG